MKGKRCGSKHLENSIFAVWRQIGIVWSQQGVSLLQVRCAFGYVWPKTQLIDVNTLYRISIFPCQQHQQTKGNIIIIVDI